MLSEPVKSRHPIGLIAIALTFGAPALMLWMGRFKLSLFYLAANALLVFAWFFGAITGFIPTIATTWLSLDTLIGTISWGIASVALLQSFLLNKQQPQRPWYSKWYVALPAYTLALLGFALVVRTFFYQTFNIPSASNEPSLMRGDYIFVSKMAYRNEDPQRGDIAVFKFTRDTTIDYVKRIIGVPGDRIQMKDGIVYLNEVALKQEPFVLDSSLPQEPGSTFFRETLPNGRSYVISNTINDSYVDNTDVYIVPDGHYFAIGDNRDNSQDSRFLDQLGYIPRVNLIGRYAFRFWNSEGTPLTGRPEEIHPR